MTEIVLHQSRIIAFVCQVVAGRVSKHVRVNMKLQLRPLADLMHKVVDRVARKCPTLAQEQVRQFGIAPLAQVGTERTQFITFNRLMRRETSLLPPHE